MTPTQSAGRRIRATDPLLASLIGIVALFLAVNGVMLWFTLRAPPQLVSKSYYDDATRYDQVMEAERDSQATGWNATALERSSPGSVALRVVDAQGRPVSGLAGALSAYRPSDSSLDRVLPVREQPGGSGLYVAPFAGAQRGHWELRLDLRRGTSRLIVSLPWTAP
jgi:nitrogen fixation protein FixH